MRPRLAVCGLAFAALALAACKDDVRTSARATPTADGVGDVGVDAPDDASDRDPDPDRMFFAIENQSEAPVFLQTGTRLSWLRLLSDEGTHYHEESGGCDQEAMDVQPLSTSVVHTLSWNPQRSDLVTGPDWVCGSEAATRAEFLAVFCWGNSLAPERPQPTVGGTRCHAIPFEYAPLTTVSYVIEPPLALDIVIENQTDASIAVQHDVGDGIETRGWFEVSQANARVLVQAPCDPVCAGGAVENRCGAFEGFVKIIDPGESATHRWNGRSYVRAGGQLGCFAPTLHALGERFDVALSWGSLDDVGGLTEADADGVARGFIGASAMERVAVELGVDAEARVVVRDP